MFDRDLTGTRDEIFEIQNNGNGPSTAITSGNRISSNHDIANDFISLVRLYVDCAWHVRAAHTSEYVALNNTVTAIDKADSVTILIICAVEAVISNCYI